MARKRSTYKKPQKINRGDEDEFDGPGSKIKAIRTWDDVEHDSEDEFFEKRDKILLEDEAPQADEDESEEEVFGIDVPDSDEEEEEEEEEEAPSGESSSAEDEDEAPDYDRAWGSSKKAYYDADEASDLDEAKEEEAEALRLQKKRLTAMQEEDFLDEEIGWTSASLERDEEAERKLVEDFSKDLEDATFDVMTERIEKRAGSQLSAAEKVKILQNESPELIELLGEFKEKVNIINEKLAPILEKARTRGIEKHPILDLIRLKYQTLLNYLTNVSFYFVLKSSATQQLREHPVIDSMVNLKTMLNKIEKMEKKLKKHVTAFMEELEKEPTENGTNGVDESDKPKRKSKQKASKNGVKSKATKKKASKAKVAYEDAEGNEAEEEDEDESEDALLQYEDSFKSMKKLNKKRKRDVNDFGDLEAMDMVDAEDKAQRKKSLRHYASKIDQAASKKTLNHKYQGDVDIPYKDRTRAVQQPSKKRTETELDDEEWDEVDFKDAAAAQHNNEESDGEDMYEAVASSKRAKLAAKRQAAAEWDAAHLAMYDDEAGQLPDGSKRQVDYAILKNKGLTPHRRKEQRNPRVKHRKQFEKASKKLTSFKRVYKAPTGAYGGEATGIKTKLSRSVRFN
ncbi:uncharacterized protein VTP21DRAFT_8755 [Calcarisporiella thermophila]|uniref:uncharacterized protein n=1 Tax=Calcarisporiella thermophila TaxID=911321 RepID=UPI0037424817